MRTSFFMTFLLFSGLLANAQSNKVKASKALLLGTWIVEEGRLLIIEANDSIRMVADGEVRKSGTWRLNEEADVFYILEQGKVIEEMRILRLSKDEFEFQSNNKNIILLKMGNRSRGDAIHKPFAGRWMENERKFIVLEENGEAYRVENFEQQGKKILWRVEANQKELHLQTRKNQQKEVMQVEKITAKELAIRTSDGEKVLFYQEQDESRKFGERQKLLSQGKWMEIPAKAAWQMQFFPKGKLIVFIEGILSEEGTWELSADAVFIKMVFPQSESIEHMRIIKLDKTLLLLQHRKGTARFHKTP